MSRLTLILCLFLAGGLQAQVKTVYIDYDKLMDLKGTSFVLAVAGRMEKITTQAKLLLFIDTKTGAYHQVEFPETLSSRNLTQLKIDSLNINLVLVSAKTVDLDKKNGVGWGEPTQLMLFSPDGKQRTQVTENHFFVQSWQVNEQTGRLLITGHLDSNGNHRYDRSDKEQIIIYDLRTLQTVYSL